MKGRSSSGRRRGRHLLRHTERKPEKPAAAHSVSTELPSTSSRAHGFFLLLKQEHERLTAEIRQLAFATQEAPEASADEADGANDLMEERNRLALKRQLEATLVQVEHALQRLEAGSYGLCERCGKLIAPARLQALPYASLCIRCAALRPA